VRVIRIITGRLCPSLLGRRRAFSSFQFPRAARPRRPRRPRRAPPLSPRALCSACLRLACCSWSWPRPCS
jgi:hypothetical protein